MELKHRKAKKQENEHQAENEQKKKEIPVPKKSSNWHFPVIVLFTFISFVLKTTLIHFPDEVVFDEVHFGKFASFYLRGEYYFDVHPPLGKMLLAGVGYLVGFDGSFLFDKIGDSYTDNEVPYVALRVWCTLCGALVTPFALLILKELNVSITGIILGGVLLVFDTALTTQSRMILLDSMLLLFCVMAIYFWVKFQSFRHESFTLNWWLWLSLTGVGLALVLGVKMVGLFTVATVGVATIADLWYILDIKKGYSLGYFGKQFAARALCLIILPTVLYLIPFYLHFSILHKSGTGDDFMSLRFQSSLDGNIKTANSTAIPFHSVVTFQHVGTNFFIHSHNHHYPLKHDDGKISSEGQQVNAYGNSDKNSTWEIVPVETEYHKDEFELTPKEKTRGVRYLKDEDFFRLKHVETGNYMTTHDVASPLTTTNMEITALSYEKTLKRYDDTVWQIKREKTRDSDPIIKSKRDVFFILSPKYSVALHTFKKKLPKWGFKMQEMNGNKKTDDKSNLWMVASVEHERIVDGVEIGEKVEQKNEIAAKKMPFLAKFFELQGLMIQHNSALVKAHPYSSHPLSWPFSVRGISFWEKKEGLRQIYLLSNPFAWWIAIMGPFLFVAIWIMDRIFLHRGIDDLGYTLRRWCDRSIGFLFVAWALHWFPFFLMGRMLFLHHYLPAYIFSVLQAVTLYDFIGREFMARRVVWGVNTRLNQWRTKTTGMGYKFMVLSACSMVIFGFWYFSPFVYGSGFPSKEELRAHKWLRTWDFQYA